MVDRISKIKFPDHNFRINKTGDALERERDQEQQQDASPDGFDVLSEKTDWHVIFEQPHLWQQNVEIFADEIASLQFQGVNLKTDPSLLKVRVGLNDGTIIPNAFLSVARTFGLQIKNAKRFSEIDVLKLTGGKSLWLTVPKDEKLLQEEITRITQVVKEKTFSQTLKRLIFRRSWLQKFGIQDPVSRRINKEIFGVYLTILVLLTAFVFGYVYLF